MCYLNHQEGNLTFFILELIYKQLILRSDINVSKGSMSALMLYFQFKFFWINIPKRILKFITIIISTEIIYKFRYSIVFNFF